MPRKAIDLQAVEQTLARLDQFIAEHPELTQNPERQQALADWLETFDEQEEDHGPSEDR